MHIVTTTSQVVEVIPREVVLTVDLLLRDEQTKVITSKEITGVVSGNFVQFDLNFTATEGSNYTFRLFNGSDLLYYGCIFCTDQTNLDAYKITDGEYTTPTATNNDYTFA